MTACKKGLGAAVLAVFCFTAFACAPMNSEQYNTQRGAAIGGGLGALLGQAIGHNTQGTIIGLASGAVLGALVGNAQDQSYAATRSAADSGKRVVYYDDHGGAVEAAPMGMNQSTNCHKVQKKVWSNGQVVSDTIEEVCEGTKQTGQY
ncbi:MAG: hypothetical protein AUK28_01335 [Desulfobacterales bacterium CG2_30_60_27]|nr:MAG: hypothetical protein AUK28_01335 [Desulfobacterales bacterium CG2_30_60_27]